MNGYSQAERLTRADTALRRLHEATIRVEMALAGIDACVNDSNPAADGVFATHKIREALLIVVGLRNYAAGLVARYQPKADPPPAPDPEEQTDSAGDRMRLREDREAGI